MNATPPVNSSSLGAIQGGSSRDLSAAPAVVLKSPYAPPGSECGFVRGTHFVGFSYEHNPPVECSSLSAYTNVGLRGI